MKGEGVKVVTVDTLFINGQVVTMAPRGPIAEAVAIFAGKVVGVGSTAEVKMWARPGTPVVDLEGRLLLPGFTDSHVHFLEWAALQTDLSLHGAASLAEALSLVQQRVARLRPGQWLRGTGWDWNVWPEGRPPTRADLDPLTPRNPVFLSSKDGHSAWVNSAALRLANVTRNTPDPPSGRLERDETGEPTGILKEGAQWLVHQHLPARSLEERLAALRAAWPLAHRVGLTGIHNCEGPAAFEAFQILERSGELPLRVVSHLAGGVLEEALAVGLRSGFGSDWHRVGGVKLFLDGALGSQTAAMLEPYQGTTDAGLLEMSKEELEEVARKAAAGGIPLAIHAIGDRANRQALDVLQALQEEELGAGLRHRIEHAQHLTPEDLPRFGRLGVIASVQPLHATDDIDLVERYLGGRGQWAYPFRSLLETGATLCFGSDAPVADIAPLRGIHAAVTRQRADGTPAGGWYPQQRLSVAEAVRAYTSAPAYAVGEEGLRGRIQPGQAADFVALSRNLFQILPEEILGTEVDLTVVDGKVVFDGRG